MPVAPPPTSISSVDVTADVELDDDPSQPFQQGEIPVDSFSVDNLLAITGEEDRLDIDAHAKSLKLAAGERKQSPARAPGKPSLILPSPADLGSRPSQPPPSSLLAGNSRSKPPPVPAHDTTRPPSPARLGSLVIAPEIANVSALADLIAARIVVLESADDPVGLSRAHVELAMASELLDDGARVDDHLESALRVSPDLGIAHSILRRRMHGAKALSPMLEHLQSEIRTTTVEAASTGLLAEKARLLEARSDETKVVRAAWESVLARSANQPSALKGLEHVLATDMAQGKPDAYLSYARHLGVLGEAYASQPELAAWIHVERARVLERQLGRDDEARGALERAMELDGSVGPVRNAMVEFLATHDDASGLLQMLDAEAELERKPSRSARLELDAAILAQQKLGDEARAIALLERAAMRAPTNPSQDRRVLDELIAAYEKSGQSREAMRTLRARLPFLTEPSQVSYDLRRLAAMSERLGELQTAATDLEQALSLSPDDTQLLEELDRLLSLLDRHEDRKALWLDEAQKAQLPKSVAKYLCRAARLSELLDASDEAIRHLEAAKLVAPSAAEPIDELARLLTPAPSEKADGESRRLIELYTVAAASTAELARKVAYLEKVALLWEDIIGDARRASRTYEEILGIEPDRRSAILGLTRSSTRSGDFRAKARALLDEARLSVKLEDALELKLRAADALLSVDATRALSVVSDVLLHAPEHTEARILETQLHENAGRFELAASSIRTRIDLTQGKTEKVRLWLALAQIQDTHLRAHDDALYSLKAARALDPAHLVPPVEIARILRDRRNDLALKQAFEGLAQTSTTAEERAHYLVRAAEVEEFRNSDDGSAARLYVQALIETPTDDFIADRLSRVLARRAKQAQVREPLRRGHGIGLGERITLLHKRLEREGNRHARQVFTFELASLVIELGQDLPRAVGLLEQLLQERPDHSQALRTLEALHRESGNWGELARVLSLQGDHFVDARARLGSLWTLASIEEWKLLDHEATDSYSRILELDPTDPGALEAVLRTQFPIARRGDVDARDAVVNALRAFTAFAADDSARLLCEVQLALVLESWGDVGGTALLEEALERYAVALSIEQTSVTAAAGMARLSNRLRDIPAAVVAATALAELSKQKPKVRAKYLLDAATLLLSQDAKLSARDEMDRSDRSLEFLEQAIDVDPNSIAIVSALSGLRHSRGEPDKLVDALRSAILRAKEPDVIVMIGTEIATTARDDLRDLPVAIEAMRKVREASPAHTPSLLTLSELYIAARDWDQATETLETIASSSPDVQAKLTALFALARIYEKILKTLGEAERVLRAAVELEPQGARGIRALLHRLATRQQERESAGGKDLRQEIADLLERLSIVERDAAAKTKVLLQLADVRQDLSEMGPAERALVEAIAHSPSQMIAMDKLARFFKDDPNSHARSLHTVIARGRELGTSAANWFAALGRIEIEKLGRVRDGISHLRQAIRMDSTLYEVRLELGSALARMGANEDAARVLLEMISPVPEPIASIADPAAALDLLERTLTAERRPEEALVVSELRAIAGDLDDGRQAWLRARRLSPLEAHHAPFERASLQKQVIPAAGNHVLLDVAYAVSGLESKILRADLTDLGISPRDRIGRGHPVRTLLDRVAKAAMVGDVELVITSAVSRTRVLMQDEPWIVMPRKLLDLPEPTQLATLARAVAKIALSVPWLEELPPPHVEALLVACARQVAPHYGAQEVDVLSSRVVAQYEPTVQKMLSRKQRKNLEDLLPKLNAPEGRPIPIDAFTGALSQGELRIAYLLTGDLLATIDELRGLDASFLKQTEVPGKDAVAAVMQHPFAGDVCRFALTPEATALRRRVGSTWAG
jgi:cellulose synthase operon protein C